MVASLSYRSSFYSPKGGCIKSKHSLYNLRVLVPWSKYLTKLCPVFVNSETSRGHLKNICILETEKRITFLLTLLKFHFSLPLSGQRYISILSEGSQRIQLTFIWQINMIQMVTGISADFKIDLGLMPTSLLSSWLSNFSSPHFLKCKIGIIIPT